MEKIGKINTGFYVETTRRVTVSAARVPGTFCVVSKQHA